MDHANLLMRRKINESGIQIITCKLYWLNIKVQCNTYMREKTKDFVGLFGLSL